MRALCGAIITAGAAIALGLAAIGVGTRYQIAGNSPDPEGERVMHLFQMDGPLAFIIAFLSMIALVGLGIAFFGLAYHHHRRHHEHLREQEKHEALRTARAVMAHAASSSLAGQPPRVILRMPFASPNALTFSNSVRRAGSMDGLSHDHRQKLRLVM
jgi:hypothetical protein